MGLPVTPEEERLVRLTPPPTLRNCLKFAPLFLALICSTIASLAECTKTLCHATGKMDHPPGKRLVGNPDRSWQPFGRKE